MNRYAVRLSDGTSVVVNAISAGRAIQQVQGSPSTPSGTSVLSAIQIPGSPLENLTPGMFGGDEGDTGRDSFASLYGLNQQQADQFRQNLGAEQERLDPGPPEIPPPVDPNAALNEAERQLRDTTSPVIVYTQYDPVQQRYVPSSNNRAVNATRVLVDQKIEGGTVFRRYRYNIDGGGPPVFKNFIVNASEATDVTNPLRHEVGITAEAYNQNKSFVDLTIDDIEQFTEKGAGFFFPFLSSASVPDWFESTMLLSGKSIEEDGRFFTFGVGGGQRVEDVVQPGAPGATTGNVVTGGGENNLQGAVLEDEDDSPEQDDDDDDEATNTQTEVVRSGSDNILSVSPAPDYPQASLGEFLRNLGYTLPTDADGRVIPLDALTTLPGFPPELLSPANLFVRVESEVTLEDGSTAIQESFVPNPAIEAALELYGREIQLRSNLAGDANDLIQAQISATGGVLPGPAGTLDQGDFNELATNLRVISSTGGRLSAEFTDQGTEISLSPLAQADFTAEVLRQTGGRVGGYYDAQGNFVAGETFDQFLADQKQDRELEFQRDLERISAQNAPSVFSTQVNRQQSDANRRRGLLQDITNIYQNPAQLAAIVQAGGGPLLQLQAELAGTPNLPVQQGPGLPMGQPQTAQQTPFIGTGGTYLDPNFRPPSGLTLDEYIATLDPSQRITQPMNQTQPTTPVASAATPMNQGGTVNVGLPLVTGYDPGRTEADFANLSPLQQQQAFGSAAVFGKQPEDVLEDLASFTPGEQQSPLFGVGGTTVTTRY